MFLVSTSLRQPTLFFKWQFFRFGAPAYMSFPHFYLADPIYTQAVDGMHPDPEKHATRLALEPSTGMPLRVNAAFQLNLLMLHMEGVE